MKYPFYIYLFLMTSFFACNSEDQKLEIDNAIAEVKENFAPDKRVALFEVQWEDGKLLGETNLPEAHDALLSKLKANNIEFSDSIQLLPSPELGSKHLALVTNSVANIRSAPKHSAELATQALMGTPLKVLKSNGSWYLVQTPDDYISWVDAAAIVLVDQATLNEWFEKEKVVVTEMISSVYTNDNFEDIVSDITAGNVLEVNGYENGNYLVTLPDQRKGVIQGDHAINYEVWKNSRNTSDANLIQTARKMMGSPYLWGGTSPKGIDCSGFTKTIYFLNGMVIPRDASQQVNEGELIDEDKNWENLQVGDLLFFGVPATETSKERVVHVGMWIGDGKFIHSRGRVRISSFDPEDEHFDAAELNRYLRTKRIRNQPSENILTVEQVLQ
ncbi:MAG: C40 family peptidase [Cytophagales bacterium]|uniref:C40 family peptidase n=1 Tax=Cyclobacterium marinum TaxID=104 RepID=UPI0011EC8C2B|nr:C40 family peptidase [Cyclobacterium marinum]MBI0398323.1 C40 family peptidase [Cyclobacterium marinum]MBR9776704.1 C40 family peptidase [Cytophagales bacterium]|tara:strand:- start:197028 stop:198188 length:1161 start_codon:yes stop_codon:yes gene_type:complete